MIASWQTEAVAPFSALGFEKIYDLHTLVVFEACPVLLWQSFYRLCSQEQQPNPETVLPLARVEALQPWRRNGPCVDFKLVLLNKCGALW